MPYKEKGYYLDYLIHLKAIENCMIIFQERWLEETEAGIDGGEAQGMEDERLLERSWTGEFFLY